jgi:MerR family transcriptional regulator, light-induced transcriptional regulator
MESGLSIKDLENFSGIKAHTIRIWEKRYNIFEPQRTQTNIRLYNNSDLVKLLNITSILDNGMKISRAATLTHEELGTLVQEIQEVSVEAEEKILVNDLIIATLNCDSFLFEDTFTFYCNKFGFESTIERIIYPLLMRIGLMWTMSKLNPAQEHFTSQLIRQKLYTAVNDLPMVKSDKKFLLYLPDKQYHEIGLLYAHYLIRKSGNQSVYLGTSIPMQCVLDCANQIEATHILCSFTLQLANHKMTTYLNDMTQSFTNYKVYVHQPINNEVTDMYKGPISFISTLNDLKEIL